MEVKLPADPVLGRRHACQVIPSARRKTRRFHFQAWVRPGQGLRPEVGDPFSTRVPPPPAWSWQIPLNRGAPARAGKLNAGNGPAVPGPGFQYIADFCRVRAYRPLTANQLSSSSPLKAAQGPAKTAVSVA